MVNVIKENQTLILMYRTSLIFLKIESVNVTQDTFFQNSLVNLNKQGKSRSGITHIEYD